MRIEVECDCGRRFAAKERLAGKRVECPACGAPIKVPGATLKRPKGKRVRCKFCHEFVPRSKIDRHVQRHLRQRADGQQADYATLPPDERAPTADFATAPRWYRHRVCGEVTGMPEEIIRTYLRDPWFYLSNKTFCTGCGRHVHQRECAWEETGENLQTYTERLRDAKPEMRPGLPRRILIWVVNIFVG